MPVDQLSRYMSCACNAAGRSSNILVCSVPAAASTTASRAGNIFSLEHPVDFEDSSFNDPYARIVNGPHLAIAVFLQYIVSNLR